MDLSLFGGMYARRRVLVTGHTGFKGSWLALWLHSLGAHVSGLALAPDSDPAHWSLLGLNDVHDHRVDLRNARAVRDVLETEQPEIIFHLAAQPLVRRSYQDPATTFASNVMGLVHLLEAVRGCASVRVLVNATTDKVYAEHAGEVGYRESDPLGGHDPYSSSKACAELVTDCYRKSFLSVGDVDVRIATARAGNVIGGGDWAQDRLVPDLVRATAAGQPLQVRNRAAVRPWQHVLEPLSGYLRLAQRLWEDHGLTGAWNFGPGRAGEVSVQSLVERLGAYWDTVDIRLDGGDHPHEAAVLRLDSTKAHEQLGWQPVWDINTTVVRTSTWYRAHRASGRAESVSDLEAYVAAARASGLAWTR